MTENYTYGMDDILYRTFMMPAVMPNNTNLNTQMNMISKTNTNASFNNQNMMNKNNKFLSPKEGFLRGNMEAGTYIPYKNMTYIPKKVNTPRESDLYKLQEIAFAAHDINLYLDTHPNDTNAIKLYNEYNKQERMLNDQYERKYGPVDLSDTEGLSMTPWAWIENPWPWNE